MFRSFLRNYKMLDEKLKVVPHSGTMGCIGVGGIACTFYAASMTSDVKVDKISNDVVEVKELILNKTGSIETKLTEVSSDQYQMKISVEALTEDLKPKA